MAACFGLMSLLEIQQHQGKGCLMVMANHLDLGHDKKYQYYYKNKKTKTTMFTLDDRGD